LKNFIRYAQNQKIEKLHQVRSKSKD